MYAIMKYPLFPKHLQCFKMLLIGPRGRRRPTMWRAVAATAGFNVENSSFNISCVQTDKRRRSNANNSNNVNITSGEFRTISLGIHSELAKLRTALTSSYKRMQWVQKPLQREVALDIARQITSLSPDPLFITVGNNGSDMCVAGTKRKIRILWILHKRA